jgi:gamma-glutamylcysteine synthetase
MEAIQQTYGVLAERYAGLFRETVRPIRRIGREAEFPLVHPDGRAGDVARMWEPLMTGDEFVPQYDDPKTHTLIAAVTGAHGRVEVEVGRATIELVLGPYEDLWQLEEGSRRLVRQVAHIADRLGMRLLGFGIQPRSRASSALMTPKKRYVHLARAAGPAWWHFTTTAADQIHVDITRTEITDAVNVLNLLSAPLIALTANSSVYAGRAGRYLSGREGLLGGLGTHRAGMTPGPFDSVEEFVRYICGYRCYVLKHDGGFRQYNRPFEEYLRRYGPDIDAYLWHEHYTWNSARPRALNSTIEVRPACQQPHEDPLVVAALALGWVEALDEARAFVADALADPWASMQHYRHEAIVRGLRGREPVERFVEGALRIAEAGLRRRGRGEERFLGPLWSRLEQQKTPGDRARDLVRSQGVAALVESVSYHP